jgi:hypothetical protein
MTATGAVVSLAAELCAILEIGNETSAGQPGASPRRIFHECSKLSASTVPVTSTTDNDDQLAPSRHRRPRAMSPDTFTREGKTVAAAHGVRMLGFLGVKRSPGLSCPQPWTPGG